MSAVRSSRHPSERDLHALASQSVMGDRCRPRRRSGLAHFPVVGCRAQHVLAIRAACREGLVLDSGGALSVFGAFVLTGVQPIGFSDRTNVHRRTRPLFRGRVNAGPVTNPKQGSKMFWGGASRGARRKPKHEAEDQQSLFPTDR